MLEPGADAGRDHSYALPGRTLATGCLLVLFGRCRQHDTFLKHVDDISHVVFIHGFDFFDQSAAYNTAVERNARFVAGYGKKLIPVETNFYTFGYRYAMSRNLSQGGCLASVALLLGFATAYVLASLVYNELEPLGSHPLTDPLWSNEAVELVHDGCEARRTDKLRVIAASEAALNNLRVCFVDMNVNCGAAPSACARWCRLSCWVPRPLHFHTFLRSTPS